MHRLNALLSPGIGIKRWLAIFVLGLLLFGLGVGFAMAAPLNQKILPILRAITFGEQTPFVRGGIFILMGLVLVAFALFRTYRLFLPGVIRSRGQLDPLNALMQQRRQRQGLRIVSIGGGTGMSTLLRGLKQKTSNLTAIVTVSDDGGSSGRLREDLRVPPLGDARNCLVALSESEPLLEELFSYRFNAGTSLGGHSLGNLLLAALYDIRGGFQESLEAAAELLPLSGKVVPASAHSNVVLVGQTMAGHLLKGESAIGNAPEPLQRVWLEPQGAVASEAALEAIRGADLIVIGPGSLYTSIIPNFLFEGMREAIVASPVPKVFICNVATQLHETDGYDVADHLRVFQQLTGVPVTHVLVNSHAVPLPQGSDQASIAPQSRINGYQGAVVLADVVDEEFPTRHDPRKLAEALVGIESRSRVRSRHRHRNNQFPTPQAIGKQRRE